MLWTISPNKADAVVLVTSSGSVSMTDVAAMHAELLSSEFLKPGGKVLFDNRDIEPERITGDGMDKCASMFARLDHSYGVSKVAVLVSTMTQYGLAHQYQGLLEARTSIKVQVFRDEEEAYEWLRK